MRIRASRSLLTGLVIAGFMGTPTSANAARNKVLPTPEPAASSDASDRPVVGLSEISRPIASVGWFQFQFDPSHRGVNPFEYVLSGRNVDKLELSWVARVQGIVQSSPGLLHGILYVAGPGQQLGASEVYALDADSGGLRWRQQQDFGNDVQGLAAFRGRVFVGTLDDHRLHAYDANTGQALWTFSANGAVSGPTVTGNRVYIQTNFGRLYALDQASGDQIWQAKYGGDSGIPSPAVANGLVYVATDDLRKIKAFDASSGVLRWQTIVNGAVLGSPAVAGGLVYAATLDTNTLFALDAGTGDIVWRADTGAPTESTPAIARGIVYLGANDGMLSAYDAATGNLLWRQPTGHTFGLSSPVVANGVVYAATTGIYAFDAATGSPLWFAPTGPVNRSAAVLNGAVYVGDFDERVRAFRLPGP